MIQRDFEALSTNQQFYEWLRALDVTPIEMRQFEHLSFSQQLFQIYEAVQGSYEQRKFESLPMGRQLYQIYAELAASPISQVQFESVGVGMQLYNIYAAGEVAPMSRQKFLSLTRSQQLWYLVEGAGGVVVGPHPECVEIVGATFPYVFQPEDEGFYIRPYEVATNSEGSAPGVWGAAIGPIMPEGASINTAMSDMGDVQGENGWEAGRMTPATPGSFTTATMTLNAPGADWRGDSGGFPIVVGAGFLFPAAAGLVSAAARYTAVIEDEVLITVSATVDNTADGVHIRVYHNTTLILSHLNVVNFATVTSNTTVTLEIGDTVTLEVDPITGNGTDQVTPCTLTIAST